ncbi:hypothetical protein [Alkalihalobacterium alkalinitrilicum]|uniref:hypothetical protein n=1 Tax=Alkalihalobacterium alkalinitrilicum TaxID=427920 RepID=UPI0009957BDC|nr:hypothetical protein [Alkalihalobacterium alkalinitrilicum]
MLNLKQYDHDEINDLEGHILELYKKITSSTYLKDVQISELVEETMDKLHKQLDPLSIVDQAFMIMNGLLSLSVKFTTYTSFERRFHLFLTILGDRIIGLLDNHFSNLKMEEKQAITEVLVLLFIRYLDLGETVWYNLLPKWLVKNEHEPWVKPYYQYFQKMHQEQNGPFQLTIITSLLALICQDGVGSLTYLKLYKQRLTANDLYHHFSLLNTRREWDTMQRWFELFTASWNHSIGNLQPFYTKLIKHNKSSFHFTDRLTKWINYPTLQSYMELSSSVENNERELLFEKVKESFNNQLSYPTIQKLFIEIILYEKKWDEAIYYFLNQEHNPFQLSVEKQQLLEKLEKHLPERTIPIYHQFIVRLVEKKTRSHYSDAVQYMKKLKRLYETLNQTERFHEYTAIFKQTYKTYRALIQEMKTIDE